MNRFLPLLKKVVRIIENSGGQYSLVGGLAVSAWGFVRATEDIDLLVNGDSDLLKEAFEAEGLEVELRRGDFFDPIQILLKVKGDGIYADLIIATHKWEIEMIKESHLIEVEGISLSLIRVEDLMVLKLRAGGTLDKIDVDNLVSSLKERIDLTYLKKMAKRAGVKLDKELKN